MVLQCVLKLLLLSGDFLMLLNLSIILEMNISILLRFKWVFILENKE